MSELRTDTITASDGTSPVTLTKQSAAKVWVNFNGTGTIAARDSLGVSGLLDNGAGDYTANFTNSMSNANFMFSSTTSGDSGNYGYTFPKGPVGNEFVYATSSIRSSSGFASDTSSSAAAVDVHQFNVSVHGDLA